MDRRRVCHWVAWVTSGLALGGITGCGGDGVATEAGAPDVLEEAIDLCGAFTSAGGACPRAGPTRCFPMCRTGGCFCRAGAGGPAWTCTTDTSCLPQCGPLDDACAASSPGTVEDSLADGAVDGDSE